MNTIVWFLICKTHEMITATRKYILSDNYKYCLWCSCCCDVGIGTNCVWEKHFLKRYGQMSVRKRYFEWREPYVSHLNCDSCKAQYLQNHCSELLASLWNVGKWDFVPRYITVVNLDMAPPMVKGTFVFSSNYFR